MVSKASVWQVYKSFVGGWCQVLQAISEVISPQGAPNAAALPTVEAVARNLLDSGSSVFGYDDRYTRFFFSKGGRVEFALDALIQETIDSDIFFDTYEDDIENVYESLPEHPLDDQWAFVRYNFLGPKGHVPKGPFR